MPTTGSPWFGLGAGVLLLSAAIGGALAAAALAGDGEGGQASPVPERHQATGQSETHGGVTVTLSSAWFTSTGTDLEFLIEPAAPPPQGWARDVLLLQSDVESTGVGDREPTVGQSMRDSNLSVAYLRLGPAESAQLEITVAIERILLVSSGPAGGEREWIEGPWAFRFPAGTFTVHRVPPEIIANTVEDAVRLSSSDFTGYGSTLSLAKPESVSYVETTVGQAEKLFLPYRPGGLGPSKDAPAWAIVADGEFRGNDRLTPGTPPPSVTTIWIVVVQRTEHIYSGGSTERYDLSKLGAVVKVPESMWRQYCGADGMVVDTWCSPAPE